MVHAPKEDVTLAPPQRIAGGTYTLASIGVGCKVFMTRPDGEGVVEERLAEVLSIRDKPLNPYAPEEVAVTVPKPEEKVEFYVHWDQFNKRLDEWVSATRVIFSRELELPRVKIPVPTSAKKSGTPTTKDKKASSGGGKVPRSQPKSKKGSSVVGTPTPSHASLKRKTLHDEDAMDEGTATPEEEEEEEADAEGEMDVDDPEVELDPNAPPETPITQPTFSKEEEIEKLRTSGSMTQAISEIARVKNLNKIQIGKHEVEAWYFSPYPIEYAHLPVLYVCEFCLGYFPSPKMLSRHRIRCTLLHPPGNEIYRDKELSFWEIDGKRQLTWCRNLSLLSKCFLDHKTLYYDVTPFLYYVLTIRDSSGCHIIGYFSKEKESQDNYNVACILTLPQHQRYGYGKFLIEFSYELSKKEGKQGSPEKPLSDLGLLSYRAYWTEIIVELLLSEDHWSVDEIATKTSITTKDIMDTLTNLQLFKYYRGQHVISLSDAVVEQHERTKAKKRRRIVPENLRWKPPTFTRDQLRFGW